MLLPLVAALSIATFSLLLPCVAQAQDDATIEMARQRFREGVSFYDQREYEKARLAFLQAYALKPHPSVLLNLAQSELRAGKPADSAMHFSQFIRENPGSEAELQEAELGFAAARTKVGEVKLDVDAEGATISVDGEEKGRSPLSGPLYVTPGAHRIEAQSDEGSGATSVDVGAGQSVSASIRVGAANAGGPAATVTDDGLGDSPAEDDGVHEDFSADSRGRKSFPKWFVSQPIAWVGAGLAVVGLGGGTIFAVSAKQEYDSADSVAALLLSERDKDGASFRGDDGACNRSAATNMNLGARATKYDEACQTYRDKVDSADSMKTWATVGFIVGGAALAGTIVFYFVDPDAKESASGRPQSFRAQLVPSFGPGSSSLTLVGQF
jgi:hypothetical protein